MQLTFLAVATASMAGAVVVNGEVLWQGTTVAVPTRFGVLLGHYLGLVGNLVQVINKLGDAEREGAAMHAGDSSCWFFRGKLCSPRSRWSKPRVFALIDYLRIHVGSLDPLFTDCISNIERPYNAATWDSVGFVAGQFVKDDGLAHTGCKIDSVVETISSIGVTGQADQSR